MRFFLLIISCSLLTIFSLSLNTCFAQNDSIFFIKNGQVVAEHKLFEIDSIIFYSPINEAGLVTGTFIDFRDNTEYSWVNIGEQVWMVENLAYAPSSGNYWVYYDEVSGDAIYGYLYDWNTAMDGAASSNTKPSGVQGICPAGWHLPSDAEWAQLIEYLGGANIAGGKLKEAGTVHWNEPNVGATNESGFTALPGGIYVNGNFNNVGRVSRWWSSTEDGADNAWDRNLTYNYNNAFRYNYVKTFCMSVRCLKDN